MRYLAPFLLSSFLLSSLPIVQAGETSIEAALEKARQRAGAPPSDAKAKKEKAQEASRQKTHEDSGRKAREGASKPKEEEGAAVKSEPAQTTAAEDTAKPTIKVFTLKDGRQISAVLVVELDDTYALKDKDGKLEEVKKTDVQSIQVAE
jgi:uncharacterized protein involved in copper resistance